MFVKGLDTALPEQQLRAALAEAFGSCGEVLQVRVWGGGGAGKVRGCVGGRAG